MKLMIALVLRKIKSSTSQCFGLSKVKLMVRMLQPLLRNAGLLIILTLIIQSGLYICLILTVSVLELIEQPLLGS
jgi:hypothetical protein